jgi:raffinose/stachyose/melibiose transport system permease protein
MASGPGAIASTRRAQARLGIALVSPLMIVVVVFIIFPLGSAIYYSLVDFDGVNPSPPFVGIDNYQEMFTDPAVWHALRNNVFWIVVGSLAPLAFGLILALLLWNVRRGSRLYRTVFFMPAVLPTIAIAIIWSWIYDPIQGWLNAGLDKVGLDAFELGWLGNPRTALLAVLVAAIWATTGFVMVILLSALNSVDLDLVDAARLDRANALQRLWHVILPQIMPVFLMVSTVLLVGGFGVFDLVFVMTGGGPDNASEVLGTYSFSNAFQLNRISYGTTLALLITALSIPCAVLLSRMQRRWSVHGGDA